MAAALVTISCAGEDLVLVVPENIIEKSILPCSYHVEQTI